MIKPITILVVLVNYIEGALAEGRECGCVCFALICIPEGTPRWRSFSMTRQTRLFFLWTSLSLFPTPLLVEGPMLLSDHGGREGGMHELSNVDFPSLWLACPPQLLSVQFANNSS